MEFEDYIILFKKEYQYEEPFAREGCDAQQVCREMGLTMDQLVYTLLEANHHKHQRLTFLQDILDEKNKYIEVLDKTVDELKKQQNVNDKYVHDLKVHNGKAIREKKKKLAEVENYIRAGFTGAEIERRLGISHSTLFRYKKELKEHDYERLIKQDVPV